MPARVSSPEEQRRCRLVIRVQLLIVAISIAMGAKYAAEGARQISIMIGLCVLLQMLGPVAVRVSGSHRIGAQLLCVAMWSLFVSIATLSGGIESPNLASNVAVVLMAAMLAGPRAGVAWTLIVVATFVVQFILTRHGILIRQTLGPEAVLQSRLAEPIATCFAAGVIVYLYEHGKERMLRELDREKTLTEATNRDLRVIFDNCGQGFLSLDRQGRLTGEHSAVVDSWLGAPQRGQTFSSILATRDALTAQMFQIGWEMLLDGAMPVEVCVDQLPRRFASGESTFSLEYRLVGQDPERFEKVVIIVSDISAEVAQEAAAAHQRDLLEIFDRILRDASGFSLFLEDAGHTIGMIAAGELGDAELMRALHTLKGNSLMMGLSVMAKICHELESALVESGSKPGDAAVDALSREHKQIEAHVSRFLQRQARGEITLEPAEHSAFLEHVVAGRPHRELASEVRSWTLGRSERKLQGLAEHARQLGKRLGKGSINVEIDDHGLRLDARWEPFWSAAIHVVRNAIDHGLELPSERLESGKGRATISLRTSSTPQGLAIEIGDDGRGIEWERVRERALSLGLPHETQRDLVDAIFSDGLSTRSEQNEVSGRGVGLAAVRQVCDALGGRIDVESSAGTGTTFRFVFPIERHSRLPHEVAV